MKQNKLTDYDGDGWDVSQIGGIKDAAKKVTEQAKTDFEKIKDKLGFPNLEAFKGYGVNIVLVILGIVLLFMVFKSLFLGSGISVSLGKGESS